MQLSRELITAQCVEAPKTVPGQAIRESCKTASKNESLHVQQFGPLSSRRLSNQPDAVRPQRECTYMRNWLAAGPRDYEQQRSIQARAVDG